MMNLEGVHLCFNQTQTSSLTAHIAQNGWRGIGVKMRSCRIAYMNMEMCTHHESMWSIAVLRIYIHRLVMATCHCWCHTSNVKSISFYASAADQEKCHHRGARCVSAKLHPSRTIPPCEWKTPESKVGKSFANICQHLQEARASNLQSIANTARSIKTWWIWWFQHVSSHFKP